ncbi:YihY/virulence factor BrkB family protein, partial [Mycoplasmopsis synoviae]
MKFLNNILNPKPKKLTYKKLTRLKYKKKVFNSFSFNIVWPFRKDYISIAYVVGLKAVISFFVWILIRNKDDNRKIKNKKVINRIFDNFNTKEYNFIWLSTAFLILISFIPVIYIVYFFNSVLTPNIAGLTPADFEELFLSSILGKIIPGTDNTFLKLNARDIFNSADFSSIVGSFLLFVVAIYISSGGYARLITSSNYIYDHKKLGTYIGNRFKGLFVVFMVAFWLWIMSTIQILIEIGIMNNKEIDSDISKGILIQFTFGVNTLIFFFGLTFGIYKFVPSFTSKFKNIYRGAIIATIPSSIMSYIFSSINQNSS